ncbi:MAG: hypothetical protein RL065_1523 [Bacteroidota bacterium]|jgi:hypothetical protein
MKKLLWQKNKIAIAIICLLIPIFMNCTCKHCCKNDSTKTTSGKIYNEPGVQNQHELDSIKAIKLKQKLKTLENNK